MTHFTPSYPTEMVDRPLRILLYFIKTQASLKLGLSKIERQVSSLQSSLGSLEEKQVSVTGDIGACSSQAEAAMTAANAAGEAAKAAAAAATAASTLSRGKEATVEVAAPTPDMEEIRRIAKEEVNLRWKSRDMFFFRVWWIWRQFDVMCS